VASTARRETATAVPLSEQSLARAEELIARYPQRRSALLPILFLLQAEDGYVSPAGVAQVADLLGLTKAEVGAVATLDADLLVPALPGRGARVERGSGGW